MKYLAIKKKKMKTDLVYSLRRWKRPIVGLFPNKETFINKRSENKKKKSIEFLATYSGLSDSLMISH